MRRLDPIARQKIAALDDEWVREARKLSESLGTEEDKRRQLRNIQEIAEESNSWAVLELFIRYQGARDQLPKDWTESAVSQLSNLRKWADQITSQVKEAEAKSVHMEIVSRVLGYAVRWHTWDIKK
ncbi:MAG: hypothetical protein ACUVXD_11340 [Thermodesulfobacteriota bacterium]